MTNVKYKALFVLLLAVLFAPAAWAQYETGGENQLQQNQPQQATVPIPVAAQPVPDNNPLSGAIAQGLGSWGAKHSFYMPAARIAWDVDSDPAQGSLEGTNPRGYANAAAELQFVHYWTSNMELRYTGAVAYNSDAAPQTSDHVTDTQDMSIVKQFQGKRHRIIFADQVDYTLFSNFAGSGLQGLGDIATQVTQMAGYQGIQLPSVALQQQYVPVQTILTERTSRVSNTALGEVDYRLGRRSTITLDGAYGLLNFPAASLINSNQVLGSVGYNYQPTRRDTLAVEYDYEHFWFPGAGSTIDTHFGQLKYSRRITGRLSVGGGAGPQYTINHIPMQNATILGWQAQGNVAYQRGKFTASGSASRLVGGGGGVLLGAQTNSVQGNLAYRFSRRYSTLASFGAASTQDLQTQQSVSTQFVNAEFDRHMGRFTTIFLTYYFARQTSAASVCSTVTAICEAPGTRQIGGLGLSWSYKPVPINF